MPRNRYAAIAAAIAATTVTVGLSSAGLAVAGVDLPDPASTAFERVGLSLPNQATEEERGEQEREAAVRAVIDGTPPSERRGCAFGQAVAEAARGEALPAEAKERCAAAEERRAEREAEKAAEGEEPTEGQEDAEDTDERDSFGAETSERAQGQREATSEQRRQFGQDTAQRARDRGADNGGSGRPESAGPPASPGGESRPDSAGPPAGVSPGRPDSAGPPAGVSPGRPDSAGPPAGSGSGRPEGAGPPEGAGRPGGAVR